MKKLLLLPILILIIYSCSTKSRRISEFEREQMQEIDLKSDYYSDYKSSIEVVESYSNKKKYKLIGTVEEIHDEGKKKEEILYFLKNKAENMGGDAIMDVRMEEIKGESKKGYGLRKEYENTTKVKMFKKASEKNSASVNKKKWTAKVIIWEDDKKASEPKWKSY